MWFSFQILPDTLPRNSMDPNWTPHASCPGRKGRSHKADILWKQTLDWCTGRAGSKDKTVHWRQASYFLVKMDPHSNKINKQQNHPCPCPSSCCHLIRLRFKSTKKQCSFRIKLETGALLHKEIKLQTI